MSSISQFDISYSPVEDRILLRVTSTDGVEVRLWFTRRITFNVLSQLKDKTTVYRVSKRSDEPAVGNVSDEQTKAQADFEQQQTAVNANFAEKFIPGTSFPLGEQGIVVHRIDFKPDANGPGAHGLSLSPEKGQGITIGVSPELFNTFFELIERTVKKCEWEISIPGSSLYDVPANATLQ